MKLVLTGEIGVGKSTIVRKIINKLDCLVGGFYTQPYIENRIRKGFEICDFGAEQPPVLFAHIDFNTGYRVGRYGVDLTVFNNYGANLLKKARKNAALIVMDELGIAELQAYRFLDEVLQCFKSQKDVLAVIQKRAFSYWNKRIRDFPDIEITEVTLLNRDKLPSILKINMRTESFEEKVRKNSLC